jgi:integrase
MLNVQRRHQSPCKRAEWDAGYVKCTCPVVIRGTLAGKAITKSTARYLTPDKSRDLSAARELALLWERSGSVVRPEESASTPVTKEPEPDRPTVAAAIAAFVADSKDRGNGDATLSKKKTVFEKGLAAFCREKGIRFLSELTLPELSEWRASWKVNSLVRAKRQGSVIGFVWFCERRGWYPPNYASGITSGLGKIQVKATQTGYFQPDEYKSVIDATYLYSDRPRIDKHDNSTLGGERIRTLTELMRWTGLRIRDAVTLEKSRLSRNPNNGMWSVMVYQRKTGDPVYCPIPPDVAAALQSVPASQKGNTNEKYFFWTGAGLPKTVVSNWQRSYGKLFKLAGLKEPDGTGAMKRCHPHMFRDTFAVESLLSGMRIEEVSTILGHSSIKITERHYMPWVRARQASLNQSVMDSWIKQGKVAAPPTPGRRKAEVLKFPVAV